MSESTEKASTSVPEITQVDPEINKQLLEDFTGKFCQRIFNERILLNNR